MSIATSYFSSLFASGQPTIPSDLLDHIPIIVSPDMNASLLADFTANEVVAAFRNISPRKVPGIDGLPSSFFR